MRLLIRAIDLEYCALCHCDYVEVREGASSSGQLIGRFCHSKRTTVYSEGRQMWVKFRSDIAYHRKGFSASFSRMKLRKSKSTDYRGITKSPAKQNSKGYELPCIRLARLKCELTNQDSACVYLFCRVSLTSTPGSLSFVSQLLNDKGWSK